MMEAQFMPMVSQLSAKFVINIIKKEFDTAVIMSNNVQQLFCYN